LGCLTPTEDFEHKPSVFEVLLALQFGKEPTSTFEVLSQLTFPGEWLHGL
jgi:hypothetical protein